MTTQEIIEQLSKIKAGIEADNFTRENIDALIERLWQHQPVPNK